jgi:anaerobic ribonucleoside-triphosphate reductase
MPPAQPFEQNERKRTMAQMTVERLHELFDEHPEHADLVWQGTCHDCRRPVTITAAPKPDGIHIEGGSVYEPQKNRFFLKCEACFEKDPALHHFQDCEGYSRVVGYLRRVAQWNDGKQAEFKDRALFSV